jgi:1-pyrroline-5-carboxylate dehydrogenase
LALVKMGHVNDFSNLMNAVIDEKSFDRIMMFIQQAHQDSEVTLIHGGKGDKTKGYFIEPTIILTQDPHYITMKEELFGPVLTIYVYSEKELEALPELINNTSAYALTGAVFSEDPKQLEKWSQSLRFAAGNFYLNDKPTGAVVHQQPFGGARKSGTNDKAGSMWNIIRWMSPRTLKQTQVPPIHPLYPYMHS